MTKNGQGKLATLTTLSFNQLLGFLREFDLLRQGQLGGVVPGLRRLLNEPVAVGNRLGCIEQTRQGAFTTH